MSGNLSNLWKWQKWFVAPKLWIHLSWLQTSVREKACSIKFHDTNPILTFLLQQPQIILLKEGTENSQGKPQLISNINACQAVIEAVRTTLGPRGMDKLIVDGNNKATVSNDGATILKLLDVVHPAAKTIVDIAKSQDAEASIVYSKYNLILISNFNS